MSMRLTKKHFPVGTRVQLTGYYRDYEFDHQTGVVVESPGRTVSRTKYVWVELDNGFRSGVGPWTIAIEALCPPFIQATEIVENYSID